MGSTKLVSLCSKFVLVYHFQICDRLGKRLGCYFLFFRNWEFKNQEVVV